MRNSILAGTATSGTGFFILLFLLRGKLLPLSLTTVYPFCSSILGQKLPCCPFTEVPQVLENTPELCISHPFLPDLARVERALYCLTTSPPPVLDPVIKRTVNPSLDLLEVQWNGLADYLLDQSEYPQPGEDYVLLFRPPESDSVTITSPSGYDLLALKIVSEDMDSHQAAQEAGVSLGLIDKILFSAGQKGLIFLPQSKIIRSPDIQPDGHVKDDPDTAAVFTLQWHITQRCDLHCRHCYDRSDRQSMSLDQGIHVLNELYDFSQDHNVHAQVTFTGGNPLLYPSFNTLYQEAADRGFMTAILGNPTDRDFIEPLLKIQKPEFYQVSLEGLVQHNDYIRGSGHFDRVITFLHLLKELDIYSMVMLTLTRENMDQVLLLAERLKDLTDLFTFNRLAMVGEGAALASVDPDDYEDFLKQFLAAAETNPSLSLKDNFFNLVLSEMDKPLVDGCAGYGCGAAFNFVSVLPDGEVHACRKLPSLIGNIYAQSLSAIYHSKQASQYREGSSACRRCSLRSVCRGCPAVTYGFGLDVFTDIDPYCFKQDPTT